MRRGHAALLLALLAVSLAPLVRGECTNMGEHTEREGAFSTQPEGEAYAASLDCHWHIRPADMAAGECIVIHVDVMDVDEDWDFLYVTSLNSTFTVTGWYDDPFVLETGSREVDIAFESSDDPWGDEGVVARWTVEPCPAEDLPPPAVCPNTGVRRERSGELQMIDSSAPYETLQPSMVCDWSIEPPLEAGECITSSVAYADFYADDVFVSGVLGMDNVTLPLTSMRSWLGHERVRVASARRRLHIHVETLPENTFATQSRGLAMSWWVVPCASVADRLPLLPGEPVDTVRVVGDNGTVAVPFPWRRSTRRAPLQVVFANPKFATDENTCMDFHMHRGVVRANVESRFFTREGVSGGGYYTLIGASNLSVVVGAAGGEPLVDYRVYACPGHVAIAQKSAVRCEQLGDELIALGFHSATEGASPCCQRWDHRSSRASVTLHCRALEVPPEVNGVVKIPAAAEHVWSFVRDVGAADVKLRLVTIPAGGIPSNITMLQLDGVYGARTLDLRHLKKLGRCTILNWEDGEKLYLPPSCTMIHMSNTRASLANLEELVALETVQMRELRMIPVTGMWPATLTSFVVSYAQVEHLPMHDGLTTLVCIRCGLSDPPASFPSTLRILDLSGNTLTGMLPPPPGGLVKLTCDSCGLEGAFTTLSPCALQTLHLRANDLTALDVSHCLFLGILEVARNPNLEAIGALSVSIHTLVVSDTRVPQPDAEDMAHVEELEAENVPTFNKPFYIAPEVHILKLSGSPVGRIMLRGAASFLHALIAENCELTEFPLPVVDHSTFVTLMSVLRLAHNRIRHIPQGALPVEYDVVDLSHNELESVDLTTLHNQLRGSVDLSHNKLITLGDVVSVRYLDVSHNRLTSLPRLHGTVWLDASHNQLTAVALPISAFVERVTFSTDSRTLLDLSHNNITSVRDVFLMEDADVVRLNNNALVEMDLPAMALRELDVSHNRLENLDAVLMRLGRGASVLNVGHNALRRADALRDLPTTMHTLKLDHNKFSGSLPQLSHLPKLASLDLHHSGFGVDAGECDDVTSHACIGPSLSAVQYRTADNEMMTCPVYALTHNPDVIVDMDPVEYGTSAVCECIFGFYGTGGECRRCPANALCSGAYVVPERGFWNHIHVDRRGAPADALVQRCVSYTTTATCSPDNSLATFVASLDAGTVRDMPRCAPGHTGRMCAACEDDHFEWGDRCSKCPNGAGVFFLLAASFFIVAAAVTYAYKVKPGTNASLKVLVFFTQTIQLARTTGVQMDNRVASVLDFFSGFMIDLPGIECVWRGYGLREDTFAAMTMPLWACAIVMAVYAAGASRARDAAAWWDRNVGALLLLNFMLYLRVASSVLSPLRCETDPFLGHRYFAVSPSDVCDDTVVGVSAMMVAMYVLLVPAALAFVLFRHRHSLGDDRTSARFRFLYASYRPRYWYWEGVITLRKLAILAIMASSARSSVAVPLGVFLVLVLSAVLQDRIRPFAEPRDNAMEYTSLWTLAVLFVLLTASTVPGVRMPLWVGVLVALLQFFFVTGVLVLMLQRHHSKLKNKLPSFITNTLGGKSSSSGWQESDAQDALLGGESDRH